MNKSNQNLTFKGKKLNVVGQPLSEGQSLPRFKLTANDMSDLETSAFDGKVLVVLSVPSVDTPVCANEVKRFNDEATKLSDQVQILAVSNDLPFAQARWCGASGISRVKTASDFKYRGFGENYGVYLPDLGLLARAVFVADKQGKVQHVEYVTEISTEPDYAAALSKIKTLV
jgi:thiol peroxidase